MTTRRATVLSVIGVVVAGLLASLVNAQALAGGNGRDDGLLAGPQPAPAATAPTSTPPPTGAADPASTVAATVPAVVSTFAAGPAGSVTLDGSSGALVLVAVVPAEGWLVSSVGSDGAAQVVVAFTSMAQRLVATGVLAGGEIAMTVTTETPAPGSVPPVETPTAPPTVGETVPGTTTPRPVSTDPQPTVTASATTTTVEHHDDDSDDHSEDPASEDPGSEDPGSEDPGSEDPGEDHEEPDD